MKFVISGKYGDLCLPLKREVLTPLDFRYCESLNRAWLLVQEDPKKNADLKEFLENGKNHRNAEDGIVRELEPVEETTAILDLPMLCCLFPLEDVEAFRVKRSQYKEVPYEIEVLRSGLCYSASPHDASDYDLR
jgi:hypothetical protein